MVICPSGGLGNQLFIWAAGYSLARKLDATLVAEHGGYKRFDKRQNLLRSFPSGIGPCPICHLGGPDLLCRRRTECCDIPTFVERRVAFDREFDELTGSVRLDGFFQHSKYFAFYLEDILNRIGLSLPPDQTSSLEGKAALHVRRTDYLKPKNKSLGVLGEEYFERAIRELANLGFSPKDIVVFTDSVREARLIPAVHELPQSAFIAPRRGTQPVDVLRSMASADALVTSNSSFSWWAGFATALRSRPVFFPEPWYRNGERDPASSLELLGTSIFSYFA